MKKEVLVVVDMQNDFVDGALGSKEAAAIVPNVVKKIKEFTGDEIAVTMDTHYDDYLKTMEGKKLPVPHCIMGTEGWKLNEEVAIALSETKKTLEAVKKDTFGSIRLPMLWEKEYLMKFGKGLTFTVIGLCTDICVISNVMMLKAYYPEARIVVDASCCAGVTPESHKNALEAMKMCHIEIEGE